MLLGLAVYLLRRCPEGTFLRAAVAADSETCSNIGRDILQQGGSAVDAAIAALLCTSVINVQSVGIGGGSIFTVMDSTGGKWIGVPGEIRGYEKVHKLYGKLPWADLFQPTIKLAREGITIPAVMASFISAIHNTNETRALRELFSDEKGNLLNTGDKVKFEKLADTLDITANNGADSFYTGKIAEDLILDVQEAGGFLTLKDLEMYKVNVTDALAVPLGEYQMYIPPPPSAGVLLSLILNIMKEYQIKSEPRTADEKAQFFHLYAEALKFANRLKKHIRDPNVVPVKIEKILTAVSFSDMIRAKIKTNMTLDPREYDIPLNLTKSQTSSSDDSLNKSPVFGSTSHVSVLAEDGSAVAVTSSINFPFGSQIYSPRTGVILNNQIGDFCERVENVFPGERPPTSMAPALLKSESNLLMIGASGGDYITSAIASALINHLWFKKSLKEAIGVPIIFVDSEDVVKFEPKWDKVTSQFLIGRGQNLTKFYNVVNAVEKTCGCIYAESDDRKLGKAAGY
ncbi:gamma-glutamyltransferase 5a [Nematolebias whitei]|uniref:gamma-glutamyltransferase 5a n=1 Tax=Nematolebias whitei TaxID=451745 RepID=UPI00189ACB49|nr:gamma-glutamyltransferase 5a [Nematolebias whitei]